MCTSPKECQFGIVTCLSSVLILQNHRGSLRAFVEISRSETKQHCVSWGLLLYILEAWADLKNSNSSLCSSRNGFLFSKTFLKIRIQSQVLSGQKKDEKANLWSLDFIPKINRGINEAPGFFLSLSLQSRSSSCCISLFRSNFNRPRPYFPRYHGSSEIGMATYRLKRLD